MIAKVVLEKLIIKATDHKGIDNHSYFENLKEVLGKNLLITTRAKKGNIIIGKTFANRIKTD